MLFVILGKPFKNIAIRCWSLFRDADFHTRFHFDHYEFKGLWRGQYRGYEHGKVHHFDTKHHHIIGVALALELSLSGAWLSAILWVVVLSLMIHLRRRAKSLQKRELAESIEDARIFASAQRVVDGGFPQPNGIAMNTMTPTQTDQSSMVSGSIIKPIHSPSIASTQHHHGSQSQSLAGYPATAIPTMGSPQQQILTQQQMLSQQMHQMQLLQQQNIQRQQLAASQPLPVGPNIQYVQYPNGAVVPTVVQPGVQPGVQVSPILRQLLPNPLNTFRPTSFKQVWPGDSTALCAVQSTSPSYRHNV